ncbi:MAG TPA: protease modulator HflC [Planctomycetaceae bacterium]|nr:protease modulator HflC [Planctomycetaceae bacterium]HIQ22510.1 protease modulator HflC [Planctomycetota bacterium]
MKKTWMIVGVAVLLIALWRSVIFVDQTELVIVTQFGRPVATYREAGLRLKWPYQSAIRIDRRLQIYDPRPSEFLASEKKNINLDVFVCWRVQDPLRFLETVTDIPGAEARLHDIVWSELAAEVGKRPVDAIVSTDPQVHQLDELIHSVAAACASRARTQYGIDIVDVRLKRISYPAEVRESVFQRMRAERARMANRYRAEGEEESMKIRAEADKQRTVLLAQAQAESQRIRGDAEAEATRIYAQAHAQDPQFYRVQRTLEAYKRFLDEKTTVLLSADSELLRYLTREPAAGEPPPGPPAAPSLAEHPSDGGEP